MHAPTHESFFQADYREPNIYQYTPLQEGEIRLLKLFPPSNEESDGLRGELISVSVNSAPAYEALSCCWGTEEEDDFVTIDNARLRLRPNLAAALQVLRAKTSHEGDDEDDGPEIGGMGDEWLGLPKVDDSVHRLLWIDAICINQEDKTERSQQVAFMSAIYSKRARLIIWLGPQDSAVNLALMALFDNGTEAEGKHVQLQTVT